MRIVYLDAALVFGYILTFILLFRSGNLVYIFPAFVIFALIIMTRYFYCWMRIFSSLKTKNESLFFKHTTKFLGLNVYKSSAVYDKRIFDFSRQHHLENYWTEISNFYRQILLVFVVFMTTIGSYMLLNPV